MRAVIDPWGRARWGADVRVLHELTLGDRRADLLWVCPSDIIVGEIKGPKDRLGDGRLLEQIKEFSFYVPEVWVFVCPKWANHKEVDRARCHANVAVVADGRVEIPIDLRDRRKAKRDELCCSRLIERLWTAEVYAIAKRCTIPHEYMPGMALPVKQVRGLIARMLTGHQIMKEVATALRNRPAGMVGMASDDPLEQKAASV